jgi:dihydroneopterin aldolase
MTDRLRLRGIVCHARLGIDPAERQWQQPVKIDLDIGLDLGTAAIGDEWERTVDYRRLQERVVELASAREYRLVEALAEAIAGTLLAEFDIREIVVRVTKPEAARQMNLDAVEIEVKRGCRDGDRREPARHEGNHRPGVERG